jgi:catechol 2,3-dioxygenase-like lactoylglutathione lyase family enzyme
MATVRDRRPGPKPRRMYLRLVAWGPAGPGEVGPSVQRRWTAELDRVGRLVAEGPTTSPEGHALLFRATDGPEAERILRGDPFRTADDQRTLWEWSAPSGGTGVNLEPPPARGAGRLTDLNRVSVFVRDQGAAIAWYRDALGLEVRSRDPETEFVELSLGPGAAAITLIRPRPDWGEPSYREAVVRIGQPTGIAFQTDNVDALALRLRHHPGRISAGPREEPWGGRSLRFADPDGNEFLAFDRGLPRAVPAPRPARRSHRRKPPEGGPTAI